jgi:phenylacetate-CoA ligase
VTFSFHLAPFGFMLDLALKQLGVTSLPTGVGNTELQIAVLKDLRAEAICATPSFLHALAERAREMGLTPARDFNLKAAFVAAEMLPESLRASLESTYGMTVRQAYGTADVGCLGFECQHKNGMHFPSDCVVEIVDPQTGEPLGPGLMGEVAATNFDPVYPLIRFGTGDLSSYTEELCPCGRTTFKLTRIMGRVDQVTKVKGMFIHPGQVDQVAAKFPQLANYRVLVSRAEQKDGMTFQAELKDDSADRTELVSGLKAAMADILRLKGEVECVPTGTIPAGAKRIEDRRVWD